MIRYECAACKGIFLAQDENEDEAIAESKEVWGDLPPEELVRVCDSCYKQMMQWIAEQPKQ